MDWDNVLRDSVRDGKIKAVHLMKLPVLKTCDNWKLVEVLGWIDYQAKTSYYKGVIVRLKGNLYFVKQSAFDAVKGYLGIGHVSRIEIIEKQ
jgi:hypothetical protein